MDDFWRHIPLLKGLNPNIVAQDIVGVQPMTASTGQIFNIKHKYAPDYTILDESIAGYPQVPEGYKVVDVNIMISLWIKEQPVDMWKFSDGYGAGLGSRDRYVISPQLLTWLELRWT